MDIANILRISSPQIDSGQLQEKIRIYGLEREWVEAKKLSEE
jgi:hypothetical protein